MKLGHLAILCLLAALTMQTPSPAPAQTPAARPAAARPAAARPAASRPAAAVTTATATGFVVLPYLQNPANDAISILWRTAQPSYGWVEYGETKDLGKKQDWVVDGFRHANTVDGRARLSGLVAGKTYYYRVGYKAITAFGGYKVDFLAPQFSPVYQFALPAPGKAAVTVCLFNDLHNNYATFNALLTQYRKFSPDLTIFNGDCLADPARENVVLKDLQNYGPGVDAASRLTFFVRGNHETRGAFARPLKDYLEFPNGEYYFAYTLGPIRFIMLDGGEDKDDSDVAYSGLNDFTGYRQAQADFLKRELQTPEFKKATYHIIVVHIPLYGGGGNGFSEKAWLPVLKDAPIDLEISAHTHQPRLIKTGAAGNPYPVMIGGSPTNGTLLVLQADAHSCKLTMLNKDGREMNTVTVTPKKKGLRWQFWK